jgi:curli biogenesis system outer membrane secretion channel CsgG
MTQLQMPTNHAKSPTFDTRATWRTAVLPPSGPGTGTAPSPGLYDYAAMALMKTGRFTVVDRSVVDQLLEEQEFSYSGIVDAGTAAKLGKMLGAEAVMTVNVTRVEHDDFFSDSPDQRDASMMVKLIRVETGEVLYSATGEGSDFEGEEGALRSALEVALHPLKTQ